MTFCENTLDFFVCLFSLLSARSDFVHSVFLTFIAKGTEEALGLYKCQKNSQGREPPGIYLFALVPGRERGRGAFDILSLKVEDIILQSNRQQNTLKVKFAACSTFFKPHILPWKQCC